MVFLSITLLANHIYFNTPVEIQRLKKNLEVGIYDLTIAHNHFKFFFDS